MSDMARKIREAIQSHMKKTGWPLDADGRREVKKIIGEIIFADPGSFRASFDESGDAPIYTVNVSEKVGAVEVEVIEHSPRQVIHVAIRENEIMELCGRGIARRMRCPDGGMCHHDCEPGACFRVRGCGPLSGVYPNDEWPEEVRREHGGK